ncbi:uncharacterized protein SETTUDRAFT_29670 [Exserohilum turcica Et28A]|uniref:Uncharacterized protein n=1 Tax=Exserohilum turcicum (strain 28A) TaxID=671987 RepID=R0IGS1_EXST2|nr:uncharacterized protein SETTUDRAFT_29670 [Exserohilum turcica Et28A]EOA84440.1 hypothetical protein SETTUDRAFT_29670 [Exserohilum turcica Et28A]
MKFFATLALPLAFATLAMSSPLAQKGPVLTPGPGVCPDVGNCSSSSNGTSTPPAQTCTCRRVLGQCLIVNGCTCCS